MAWIGAVLNIVGAAAGVAGNAADGQASAAQRTFSRKVAEGNARMVGDQAAAREQQLRRESAQVLGAQRAAVAESGTGTGGSNGLIMAQDSALAELDALNTRYEGALLQRQYDNEARLLSAQKPDMSPVSWQFHRKRNAFYKGL